MLVAAGYLNYSTNNQEEVVETLSKDTLNNVVENTSIGDATLVNSDDVLEEIVETSPVENNLIEDTLNLVIEEESTEESDKYCVFCCMPPQNKAQKAKSEIDAKIAINFSDFMER